MFNLLPINLCENVLHECNLADILNFIFTSKSNFKTFRNVLLDKIKATNNDELAYLRSYGDSILKLLSRRELLVRYPQLIPMNNVTIKKALQLFFSNQNDCIKRFGGIKLWDVSQVTNMYGLFNNHIFFDEDISNWDVSKVYDMSTLFYKARKFNQNINKWDVSSVKTMAGMFYEASNFNQPLDKWDVSQVTEFYRMFESAFTFNQIINNWDVSNLKSNHFMFYKASNFDVDLHRKSLKL